MTETSNRFTRAVDKIIAAVGKVVFPISKVLNTVGVITIMAITCFIVLDIILRRIFNAPISGGYELVQLALVVVVFLAFPYTQMEKGHVSVNMVTNLLPQRVQHVLELVMNVLSIVFWGAIAYAGFQQAVAQYNKNVVSATLRIPVYPIVYVLAIGVTVFVVVLILDLLRSTKMSVLPAAYYRQLKEQDKNQLTESTDTNLSER